MPKAVKELIRDRYEKLLERMKDLERVVGLLPEMMPSIELLPEIINVAEDNQRMLARILEILEAGPPVEPNGGTNFFWPAGKERLDVELVLFARTSPEADKLAFNYQEPNMRAACNAFQDYLIGKYDDVALVNDMGPRHNHRVPDRAKHADTIVILRNPANPSEDIVVDLCFGSSEPGTLFGKLTFNWHEGPYEWWVDNNFPQQEEDGQ